MKKKLIAIGLLLSTGILISGIGCKGNANKNTITNAGSSPSDTVCPCTASFNKINYGPVVPPDATHTSGQADFDCFAWAEFIALNWPATGSANFGTPLDLTPVQWETYIHKDDLYPPYGAPPGPWNPSNQNSDTNRKKLTAMHLAQAVKMLKTISKFGHVNILGLDSLHETGQAFPGNGLGWLGAQNGTNVWYEVLLNKDIYDYVVKNRFYNAFNQADSIAAGHPINFPSGSLASSITGAIELKAAWMEVNNMADPKWKRYKLSNAVVIDVNSGQPRSVTVALVGLHILHKTASQPTWVWSTFEQVDNVPTVGDQTGGKTYNFFNAASPADSPYNNPPVYPLVVGGPGPTPINIKRIIPISPVAATSNAFMQQQIQSIYPNSVWQYYQLINVIWQNAPKGVTDTTSQLPFPYTPVAGSQAANSTLESYIQTNTCINCHTYASNAQVPDPTFPSYFADFSFAIGDASYPNGKLNKLRTIKGKFSKK